MKDFREIVEIFIQKKKRFISQSGINFAQTTKVKAERLTARKDGLSKGAIKMD